MAARKNSTAKSKKSSKASKSAMPQTSEPSVFTSPLFIHGVIWALCLLFSMIFMYLDSDAVFAAAVKSFLGGMLGIMAYAVPAVFCGTLVYLINTKSVGRMWVKFILCIAELVDMSAMIGIFYLKSFTADSAYSYGADFIAGGGYAGIGIAEAFSSCITQIGAFIVFLILFVLFGCLIAHYNILPHLFDGLKSIIGYSEEKSSQVKSRARDYMEKRRAEYEEERSKKNEDADYIHGENKEGESGFTINFNLPEEDELPESLVEREKHREKKNHTGNRSNARMSGVLHEEIGSRSLDPLKGEVGTRSYNPLSGEVTDENEKPYNLYDMKFSSGGDIPDDEKPEPKKRTGRAAAINEEKPKPTVIDDSIFNTYNDSHIAAEQDDYDNEDIPLPDIGASTRKVSTPRMKNLSEDEKLNFKDELDNALLYEPLEYKFPTIDLLDKAKHTSNDQRQELYKKAEQLIAVLDNFGVKAKPVQVTQGPTVTRYEIQPQSGIKLAKIVGLADDIALNLAVSTVLIAPVPGKAATVGVEIPNTNVTPVKIRELFESPEFRNAKSKLTVCLGKDIGGNVVVGDISKWPHALIAGATGSGKSVCINTIIMSILYKADPNEVKLIMVDPKQVELGVYNGIPHLLIPVVTEAKKAAGALNWAVQEMMHRYELFKQTGVRKLEGYNRLMEQTGGEMIPQIVIIIDELADLMMVAAKEVEDYICRLAQLARAAGIYLIIATQRPSVDVITGLIKANIPSRIAFFVSSQVDSRTIIDKAGAEKLLGMGDMLYFPTGARSTRRVQGAFVSDDEVERVISYIKDTSPETHYREDLAEHIERIQLGENGVTPDKEDDGDSLLNDAIQLAVELGKISTSMVQRRLSVGYSRAGRIIDQMEARGIISPANGAKPRDVLISHADLDMFNKSESSDEAEDDYDDGEE